MTARRRAPWAIAALAALALAGCGQDGEITLPTASGDIQLPSATRTDALPSPTRTDLRPSATRTLESPSPTRTEQAPTEEPTSEAPAETPTSEAPTEEPTSEAPAETPTSEAPTESETPSPETTEPSETPSTESPSATEDTASASAGGPGSASASATPEEPTDSSLPLWLGLAALAAAIAGLAWFLVAGSRRRRWDERLDVERAQARWVADQLVPALTDPATTPDQVAQSWGTAQPTLDQLDANLTALVAEAPDDGRALVCRSIAGAATQVRSSAAAHVALVASGTADGQALGASAAAVLTARNQLSTALGPPEEQ